jgi:hypothetical protein
MWVHVLHEFLRWFNAEYWSMSWPNVFAPSVYTILGFTLADIRSNRRAHRAKMHHIDTTSDLAGQISELSAKLTSLLGDTTDGTGN